jgi:DNA gyrase/topoisomerase IV subunit B
MATTKAALKTSYNSEHIETQRFPHNVRASAAMYIGGVDAYGRWTITKELLDNGADEFMAGRNDAVFLHFDEDGSYWVWDNGHGIPQGTKTFKLNLNGKDTVQKMPTMQAVFGELHTSGKYRSEAYAVSIGSHGVGSKGTNATSEYFDVVTCFEGAWYSIGFKKGELISPVKAAKAPKAPNGKILKKGTLIHFKPDMTIFTAKSFPPSMAVEWAEIMAYMNPGLKITLSSKKNTKTYFSSKGPQEYIEHRMEKLKVEGERLMFTHKDDLSDIVIAFANFDGCDLRGMTNSVTNNQGGKHVDSVTSALYAGLKPFIKTKKVQGKPVPAFREADLKEGLVGLVNAKLHKAQFSSQDKAKLTDDRMGKEFQVALTTATTKFFKDNKALAQRLADRATKMNELKNKFTMSKKAAASLNAVKRNGLPAKYAAFDSRTKIPDRELFIVEGDSAGGCFVGSTKVRLINGKSRRFDDMVAAHARGVKQYGYAYDIKNEQIQVIEFDEPRITKYVKELVEVTLSNGEVIQCTLDHPWLTRQGVYVPAVRLEEGDRLMPHTEIFENGRRNVISPKTTEVSVVSVRRIKLKKPIPVYDATVPKYHNFALDCGVYVHNTVKEARFPYQAVLPLKGKIMNALKDKAGKTLESEEIINILAAIGYDVKAADPYSKLTLGKIICLADPDPDGPFVGDTKIRMRDQDEVVADLEIGDLAHKYTASGVAFEVPVWTGGNVQWKSATARLERNVDTLVALEIADTKYKVSEDHKFLCHVTRAMYGRETLESQFKDLVYVAAKNLKIGDRVYLPSNNGSRSPAEADKFTKLGFAPVSKLRIQKLSEPVPVYCLTVNGYHNFILPSGIVSSNCHINSLLLTLFYRYLPELFSRGMVYVANSPEFYAIHKGQLMTGDTLSVVQKKLAKAKAPASTVVNHIKGWGEIDSNLMRILAMDPETRKLIKIKAIESDDKVDFIRLMNDDTNFRRKMLGLPDPLTKDGENEQVKKKIPRKAVEGSSLARKDNTDIRKGTRRVPKAVCRFLL